MDYVKKNNIPSVSNQQEYHWHNTLIIMTYSCIKP